MKFVLGRRAVARLLGLLVVALLSVAFAMAAAYWLVRPELVADLATHELLAILALLVLPGLTLGAAATARRLVL